MSVDFATLGVGVNPGGLKQGEVALDSFAKKAESTERRTETAAQGMTDAMQRTGGAARMQTANLAAQFNDIGVMMAAGQSPMMLALQQGTQVSQVLNQMGTGTSVLRGLGSAFMSVVNPVSLLTIGIIAGGAALGQWAMAATGAGDTAKQLEDAMDTLTESVDEYFSLLSDNDDAFARGLRLLRTEVEQTSDAYRDLIALARVEALENIGNATTALMESATGFSFFSADKFLSGTIATTGDLLEIETQLQGNITSWKAARAEVAAFQEELSALSNAGDLVTQLEAAQRVREEFLRIVGPVKDMNKEQRTFFRNLAQSIAQMELLVGGTEETVDALNEAADAAEATADFITMIEKALNSADKEALSLKDELGDAAVSMLEMSGYDINKPIDAAAKSAAVLATQLGISLNAAISLRNLQDGQVYSGRGQDPRKFMGRDGTGTLSPEAQALIDAHNRSSAAGRGSGVNQEELQRTRDRERILRSIQTAQQEYNEELAIATELLERGSLSSEQFNVYVGQLDATLREAQFETIAQNIESFSDAMADAIVNADSLGDAVVAMVRRIAAQQISSGLSKVLGEVFAGFFATGGNIPAGQYGVVGEAGAELVRGPAHVTSAKDTASMFANGGGQGVYVNAYSDPGVVLEIAQGAARREVQTSAPGIAAAAQRNTLRSIRRSKSAIGA